MAAALTFHPAKSHFIFSLPAILGYNLSTKSSHPIFSLRCTKVITQRYNPTGYVPGFSPLKAMVTNKFQQTLKESDGMEKNLRKWPECSSEGLGGQQNEIVTYPLEIVHLFYHTHAGSLGVQPPRTKRGPW